MFRENLGILKLYMNGLPILSFLYATNVGIEKKKGRTRNILGYC